MTGTYWQALAGLNTQFKETLGTGTTRNVAPVTVEEDMGGVTFRVRQILDGCSQSYGGFSPDVSAFFYTIFSLAALVGRQELAVEAVVAAAGVVVAVAGAMVGAVETIGVAEITTITAVTRVTNLEEAGGRLGRLSVPVHLVTCWVEIRIAATATTDTTPVTGDHPSEAAECLVACRRLGRRRALARGLEQLDEDKLVNLKLLLFKFGFLILQPRFS